MQKINIQNELDECLNSLGAETPKLLIHACCAPCSSYCLEYLSQYFKITVLFYNPNIYPPEEYHKRTDEIQRLIAVMPTNNPVDFVKQPYDENEFYNAVKGMENLWEGGERCFVCYHLRLENAAQYAKENGFDYFTTTLSISPYKNAQKLYEISKKLSQKYDIKFLPSDFKKKNGYKRSIDLSKEYNLYRQDYCGCVYSLNEMKSRKIESNN